MRLDRVTNQFDQWGRGLLAELTAFFLFIVALFFLSALIIWIF